MKDIQLSEHFKLSEFVRSDTATARHIDNSLNPANPEDAEIIANLRNLCEKVLEPLRSWNGKPIVISSGYRCPALNRAVGGVSASQHMKGEAADLRIPMFRTPNGTLVQDMKTVRQWIEHLLESGRFDQMILEHNSSGHYWLHITLKRDNTKNRQTYIPNMLKR